MLGTSSTSYAWIGLPLGTHTVSARAWNDYGASPLDTKTVHVTEDPIDVPFFAKIDTFKSYLGSGQKDNALAMLSPEAQRTYGPVFDILAPQMANILTKWAKPVRLSNSAGGADYLVKRLDTNKIYVISFLLDDDGNWVIDSM